MTEQKNKKKKDEGEESTFEGTSTATAEPKAEGVLYMGIDFGTSRSSVAASNGVRETIASLVGYPKDVVAKKLLKKDVLFGDEALEKRLSLNFFRPLEVLKTKDHNVEDF